MRTSTRRSSPVGRKSVSTILLAATALLMSGCHTGPTTSTPTGPLTDQQAGTGAYTLIQEPDAGFGTVYNAIAKATHSLDMTMYELADPQAQQALIDAHHRGVTVRVLLDRAFHGQKTNQPAYDALHAAGVDVKWTPTKTIVHQKTITIDATTALIGTANLTSRYYPTSRDAWIVDTDPTQVHAITTTFDSDYTAADHDKIGQATRAAGLLWSPGARPALLTAISAAQHSVEFSSEELADRGVADALAADARRGVSCRIVMTDNKSWTGSFSEVSAAGCQVHVFPDTAKTLYVHEKLILTDNANLLIGSQNASITSLARNRELSVQIDNHTAPHIISAVAATFDHDFTTAPQWHTS